MEVHLLSIMLLGNNVHQTQTILFNAVCIDTYTTLTKVMTLGGVLLFLGMAQPALTQQFSHRFEFLLILA